MSNSAAAVSARPRIKPPDWKSWLTLNNRYVPPVFITLILLGGQLSFGVLESYERTLLAIGTAMVTELVLGRIFLGKWLNLASAYITGISVGILLRSPAFWPYAVAAALAITSKYVIRYKGRHLCNPSNFGISTVLFLLPTSVAMLSIQWGNNMASVLIIWAVGTIVMLRARRFNITVTYVISFLVLAVIRAHMIHEPVLSEISPLTGPEYQLFIFFMITDPKTTVRSRKGQCIVAFLIALLEMFFRLDQSVYAELYALFWIGPIAMLIEMWLDGRRAKAAAASAPALATFSGMAHP
ncbi:MAG TPA: RnfABCDGE type electron transport complex subunit D [Acidobacteriaceae bacterium]|nr:RnfABCDGE type electron transport complex subunit D [Acidobacteriaceae bacterium]